MARSALHFPSSFFEQKLTDLFRMAGIEINGKEPFDIQVHDPRFYKRVMTKGSLGLGESYTDGWWDCDRLDSFFARLLARGLDRFVSKGWLGLFTEWRNRLVNFQELTQATENVSFHYDAGNELFACMLDSRMTYTCAYWRKAATLEQAQEDKLELTCRKLNLQPGMNVLDIGCGWGSFAIFAAQNHKVSVTGITLSQKQLELAEKRSRGLPVSLRLMDYRNVREKFDRIVSLGMFEHVGLKNYDSFFNVASKSLKDNGLFLLHTIGSTRTTQSTDPWIEKYVFPNSIIPSLGQITRIADRYFVLEDVHNLGTDYDRTLMAWHGNLTTNWNRLKDTYSEKTYRLWTYFLLSCAGSFRARRNQLWQLVFSKGLPGGYLASR